MRVLLLASRELTGPMTGRKQVLRTIVEALAACGCHTVVAAFGAHEAEHMKELSPWGVERVVPLSRPRLISLPPRLLWQYASGGMSANETLFYTPGNLKILREMVAQERIDFVVCDMLRLAPYAAQLQRPWHLDLDDLLSQRYLTLAQQGANDQLLGFYERLLPPLAMSAATWLARQTLPLEARRIARREVYWGAQAQSVSLVSGEEAARFAHTLGKPVVSLPMRAQFPPSTFQRPPVQPDLVFLGGLDYQPNLDALRYFRDHIQPALAAQGRGQLTLHMLGKAPDAARREFASSRTIVLHGYVDDLASELCRHAVFLAPITHGTGIKTKVLDALGHRLPLVTTSRGVEGIGLRHGEHCLVGDTPAELAAAIEQLLTHPAQAAELAARGQAHVEQEFSLAVIARRWEQVLTPYRPQ